MKKSLGAGTLAQPTPAWLVGTYDADGKPNVMTIAWGGICFSAPPCVAVCVRPGRHTFPAITARRGFTVNIPSQNLARETDYVGMVSGAAVDKFAVAGLTATKSTLVDAPIVNECPLVLECRLVRTMDLGAHTQFVGEILDVKADESVLAPDGHVDPLKLRPLVYAPGDGKYYGLGEVVGKAFGIGKELMGK